MHVGERREPCLVEFAGMGHDLMLDAGCEKPFEAVLGWLEEQGAG